MVSNGGSDWEAGEVVPSYDGTSLVNLAAELEIRLTGRSPTRGLRPDLAAHIPDAELSARSDRRFGDHPRTPRGLDPAVTSENDPPAGGWLVDGDGCDHA